MSAPDCAACGGTACVTQVVACPECNETESRVERGEMDMEIVRKEWTDRDGRGAARADWTAREGVACEAFALTDCGGPMVTIRAAGVSVQIHGDAAGETLGATLERGILLGRALSAGLPVDAIARAVETARAVALKAEADDDSDEAACAGCDELLPRDDLTETSAGDRMCADCLDAEEVCSSCDGTGIGSGDPDTSRCWECGGRGVPRVSRENDEDYAEHLLDLRRDGEL